MTLDLLSLDTKAAAEAGTFVYLENPFTNLPLVDDDKKPYFVKVLGGDSGKVTAQMREIADRRMEYIQRTRKIVTDTELTRQEDIDLVAAASLEWYLPPLGGEDIPFSEENAKKVYGDPRFPWILEQVQKVIGDRTRFFKKSSSN